MTEYRRVRREMTNNPIERTPQEVPVGAEPLALRVSDGGGPSSVWVLVKERVYLVGRSEGAHLHFEADDVSQKHAELYFQEEAAAWVWRDLGSTNGSYVRRAGVSEEQWSPVRTRPVGGPIGLVAGDSIRLGKRSRLDFLPEAPADALGAPPKATWKSAAGNLLEEQLALRAKGDLTVVLLGPPGVGKSYAAKRIHELSGRTGRWIHLNSGQVPHESAERFQDEFVGHVKSAYTDAKSDKDGWVFEVTGGTLFLDEIHNLKPFAQEKMLTTLWGAAPLARLGEPMANARPRPEFRIICASQVPLKEALREDLADRLSGTFVRVPGLQERREDIPLFVERFLAPLTGKKRRRIELSQDAMSFLVNGDCEGQVRGIENLISDAVEQRIGELDREGIKTGDVVLGKALLERVIDDRRAGTHGPPPATARHPTIGETRAPATASVGGRKHTADITREDMEDALRQTGGNVTAAADVLGCSLGTFKNRMRDFGVAAAPFRKKLVE